MTDGLLNEKPLVPVKPQRNFIEQGRPITKETPDIRVYEPESLKKARQIHALTDEQARRAQKKNKGTPIW